VVSEGKRLGSKKCSRLKSSSTVFCSGVPVSSTLCSYSNMQSKWPNYDKNSIDKCFSLTYPFFLLLLIVVTQHQL
jgi:hypothetical protein